METPSCSSFACETCKGSTLLLQQATVIFVHAEKETTALMSLAAEDLLRAALDDWSHLISYLDSILEFRYFLRVLKKTPELSMAVQHGTFLFRIHMLFII